MLIIYSSAFCLRSILSDIIIPAFFWLLSAHCCSSRLFSPSSMIWFSFSLIFSWTPDVLSKDYIPKLPLQLSVANWLSSAQWDENTWVTWQLPRTYLKRQCRMYHFLFFILPSSRILECRYCHLGPSDQGNPKWNHKIERAWVCDTRECDAHLHIRGIKLGEKK